MSRPLRLGLLAALLGVGACDASFDAIQPSDLVFSLSGYLDASADTQWVRVEPLARTTAVEPGPIAVEVTIEDLGRGGVAVLTQEVRAFSSGPAHLFWTPAEIALGGRYRLRARALDGAEATVDVEIPGADDFAVEVESGEFICPTTVLVTGAERVADVQARYLVVEDGEATEYRFTHVEGLTSLADRTVRAAIYAGDDYARMALGPGAEVVRTEVLVAVATSAWPDMVGITLESALQAESPGITNGVGFVGGVVSRRSPFIPGSITNGPGAGGSCVSS